MDLPQEIKDAYAKYQSVKGGVEEQIAPLSNQVIDLKAQITGLNSQIRDLHDKLPTEYVMNISPLVDAYLAQIKDKYKDASTFVAPEDFIVLGYGVDRIINHLELVDNFRETVEDLTKKLAGEGELELTLIENHPSYSSKSGRRSDYQEAYSVEQKHVTTSLDVSIILSLSDLGNVYFDLGMHKLNSIRRLSAGNSYSSEIQNPVKVPLECLVERPESVSVDPICHCGYAKCELHIKKNGEIIFQFPSEEAKRNGRELLAECLDDSIASSIKEIEEAQNITPPI